MYNFQSNFVSSHRKPIREPRIERETKRQVVVPLQAPDERDDLPSKYPHLNVPFRFDSSWKPKHQPSQPPSSVQFAPHFAGVQNVEKQYQFQVPAIDLKPPTQEPKRISTNHENDLSKVAINVDGTPKVTGSDIDLTKQINTLEKEADIQNLLNALRSVFENPDSTHEQQRDILNQAQEVQLKLTTISPELSRYFGSIILQYQNYHRDSVQRGHAEEVHDRPNPQVQAFEQFLREESARRAQTDTQIAQSLALLAARMQEMQEAAMRERTFSMSSGASETDLRQEFREMSERGLQTEAGVSLALAQMQASLEEVRQMMNQSREAPAIQPVAPEMSERVVQVSPPSVQRPRADSVPDLIPMPEEAAAPPLSGRLVRMAEQAQPIVPQVQVEQRPQAPVLEPPRRRVIQLNADELGIEPTLINRLNQYMSQDSENPSDYARGLRLVSTLTQDQIERIMKVLLQGTPSAFTRSGNISRKGDIGKGIETYQYLLTRMIFRPIGERQSWIDYLEEFNQGLGE